MGIIAQRNHQRKSTYRDHSFSDNGNVIRDQRAISSKSAYKSADKDKSLEGQRRRGRGISDFEKDVPLTERIDRSSNILAGSLPVGAT